MTMTMRLRPRPVLFACGGCAAGGQAAREVGAELDRRGLAELAWLGAAPPAEGQLAIKARGRFPIYVLDGCDKACARQWLVAQGVIAQRCYILPAGDPACAAERIAADW